MKKTFQVNINGKIYHIDEDAYTLLQNYLSQLRDAFPGDEGIEIVNDIEFRISEHFDQRIAGGASVIVIDDVNRVITIMGRPDEITDEAGFESDAREPARPSRPEPFGADASTVAEGATPPPFHKKFFRDERHKVFGGVLAGLGQYLGWDVTVLRILVVVATLSLTKFGLFWPLLLGYLICWMIIPPARTPRQILEMRGEPVTIDNVGQTVIDNIAPPAAPVPSGGSVSNVINSIFLIIGRVILVILGLAGGLVGFTTAIVGLVVVAGITCLYFASNDTLLSAFEISSSSPYLQGWGLAFVLFAIALPALCLCRAGIATLFKAPGMSMTAIVSVLVLEVLLIVGSCILLGLGSGPVEFFDNFACNISSALYTVSAVSMVPVAIS
ncbi:MAG: PspC domain-containing protein [Duncaniella sp.]|nr:PspC domain-containing protein [Duncaniella sp.]MDE5693366.1 PspC domain-containing protein [Duncaniella sp.]